MSEEELEEFAEEAGVATYNRVQLSTFVNGDQLVFRTDTNEELAELLEEGVASVEKVLENLNKFKQVVVAKGVMTSEGGGKSSKRSSDSPPPTDGDEVPHCKHGPMNDLSGRGYKKRWYCTLKTDNWRDKCKPLD